MTSSDGPRRLLSLDIVRGCAALLVCAQHLRNGIMVDHAQIVAHHPAQSALYFATNLGHESVMVFFVLSGFFVGGSVVRAGERFRWAPYLTARALRLWCVLLPCLLLTWGCDQWLRSAAPGVLDGTLADTLHSVPLAGTYDASWHTALGNALFLQTIWVPVFGSNGPLWSLANEAWYYALFPLLWVAASAGPLRGRLTHAALAALVAVALPAPMLTLFVVWLLGVGVYLLYRRRIKVPRGTATLALTVFVLSLVASRMHVIPATWAPLADYAVGLSFAALCLTIAGQDTAVRAEPLRRTASWLSDISFSLYLCHFPLVLIIAATCYGDHRMQPTLTGWLTYLAWFAGLLCAGHAMWWAFESRTPALKALIFEHRPKAAGVDD